MSRDVKRLRNATTGIVEDMTVIVIILLVLALLLGGFGLFVEGLKWLLIIAVVCLIASFVAGFFRQSVD